MRSIAVLLLACCAAGAQTLISVTNGASGLPGIVPGSLARIRPFPPPGDPFTPLDSATISVQIQPEGGSPSNAPVFSVSLDDAVIFVPQNLHLGSATVVVSSNGQTSLPAQVSILASNLCIFTQGFFGPALAPPYKLTNPALPGQFVTLWGTGLGSAHSVAVLLGGHPAPVSYAGPAPGFQGLDQINFRVPNDNALPESCYVSVIVKADEGVSNRLSIPVGRTPGPCRNPFGFTVDTLARIDAGQPVLFPHFHISSNIYAPQRPKLNKVLYVREESISAGFDWGDAATLGFYSEPQVAEDVYYSCSLETRTGVFAFDNIIGTSGIVMILPFVDLGNKFTLHGPQNSLDVPGTSFQYSSTIPTTDPVASPLDLPAPFFTGGDWQPSDSGSPTVPPFQTNFMLPPPVEITNLDQLATIHRASDQVVTWDPAGYSQSYTVRAFLSGYNTDVTCSVPASAGRLVFPAALLQALPPGKSQNRLSVWTTPRPDNVPQFVIPLVTGSPLAAILKYYSSETIPVAIQ